MWIRWQVFKPIAQKEAGGNERIDYEFSGSMLGKILSDRFGFSSQFAALKGDEVLLELKDAQGSGLQARWKLTSEHMSLHVQDFERMGKSAARILARKEGQDAL